MADDKTGARKVDEHVWKRTLDVDVEIPSHPPRKEYDDSVYQASRKVLLEDEGRGCWICGRTNDDLGPDNPYGQYLETHHLFEWSMWNAFDLAVVEAFRDAAVFDPTGWMHRMKGTPVKRPGEKWNLLPLCPQHHRYSPHPDRGAGLHAVDFATWLAQKVTKDGYTEFPATTASA